MNRRLVADVCQFKAGGDQVLALWVEGEAYEFR
jgi:hypothetical protein